MRAQASRDKETLDIGANIFVGNLDPEARAREICRAFPTKSRSGFSQCMHETPHAPVADTRTNFVSEARRLFWQSWSFLSSHQEGVGCAAAFSLSGLKSIGWFSILTSHDLCDQDISNNSSSACGVICQGLQ
eukprot:6189335-Pleurochrysis_carterae.AAC.1